jgi:hypothetical protein
MFKNKKKNLQNNTTKMKGEKGEKKISKTH